MSDHIPQGGVLAFDLSSVIGWAYGSSQGMRPLSGTWRLQQSSEAMRLLSAENEIYAAIERFLPRLIVVEAPLPLPAMNNRAATYQQLGLRAVVLIEAARARVPVQEVGALVVRGDLLGPQSRKLHRADVKRAVMAWCRGHGWHVADDNVGDALLLLAWTLRRPQRRAAA
jgi:hypothetical protein